MPELGRIADDSDHVALALACDGAQLAAIARQKNRAARGRGDGVFRTLGIDEFWPLTSSIFPSQNRW